MLHLAEYVLCIFSYQPHHIKYYLALQNTTFQINNIHKNAPASNNIKCSHYISYKLMYTQVIVANDQKGSQLCSSKPEQKVYLLWEAFGSCTINILDGSLSRPAVHRFN